jgi:hypothetical protein
MTGIDLQGFDISNADGITPQVDVDSPNARPIENLTIACLFRIRSAAYLSRKSAPMSLHTRKWTTQYSAAMSQISNVGNRFHQPLRVKRFIAVDDGCWIGGIDETTVRMCPSVRRI